MQTFTTTIDCACNRGCGTLGVCRSPLPQLPGPARPRFLGVVFRRLRWFRWRLYSASIRGSLVSHKEPPVIEISGGPSSDLVTPVDGGPRSHRFSRPVSVIVPSSAGQAKAPGTPRGFVVLGSCYRLRRYFGIHFRPVSSRFPGLGAIICFQVNRLSCESSITCPITPNPLPGPAFRRYSNSAM